MIIPGICRMNKSAGFYRWSWDIITGCKNTCSYCYARERYVRSKMNFEDVKFHEKLLDEPSLVKPAMIFVNHEADIMGKWVPADWIEKIINSVTKYNQHTFLFMTKNPLRYKEFSFPDNALLGVTIESPSWWWRAEVMTSIANRKMASVEPILGDFTGYDFSQFELVVVGALYDFTDNPPDKKYYDTINHHNIYYTR
jgi:protein gp37